MNGWHSDDFMEKHIAKGNQKLGPMLNGKYIDKEKYDAYFKARWKARYKPVKERAIGEQPFLSRHEKRLRRKEGIICRTCEIKLDSKFAGQGDGINCESCLKNYERNRRSNSKATG